MSLLDNFSRPVAMFDVQNAEHRKIYFEFVKHKGWGKSPVRFTSPDNQNVNLIAYIEQSLSNYYLEREFNV